MKTPTKGNILLSEPFLQDPNFARSVVLLTEHNEEGSIGFILNKPIIYKINEIIEDFPEFDAPVYMGGPVQRDSLHFIHRIEALADDGDEIAPGVYWGGDFEKLKRMIRLGIVVPHDIRFFVGYSGWGPQQLEGEMEMKSWIVSSRSDKFAFADRSEALWGEILQAMGGKYKAMAHYPVDPSLN
ncbi:MAG: YqgE/AlgH family protein [Bacteroidetes bacterium]|nr:YqgE/AlgH family protein [Bacteroidota bacterium]MBL0016720.1 YqgE/AlgH family protein [Bacteroidota bacterium]